MVKAKTFIHALSIFSSHPEKSKKFLEDKRLTLSEKNILRGFFLLRDTKYDEAHKLLKAISDLSDPVVRSQYHLLSGIIYNNLNDFERAINEIKQSLTYLPEQDLPYFKFIAHLNLFSIYYNLRRINEMGEQIEVLRVWLPSKTQDKVRILSCQYLFQSLLENIDEARDLLEELGKLRPEMSESDLVHHYIQVFEFHIKLRELDRAQNVLQEMKSSRKFSLSENYRYMRKLLDHLVHKQPLYFQDGEFDKVPVLLYHIKVIQKLEERNFQDALIWWNKLAAIMPQSFHANFQYTGPQNLFYLCFEMYRTSIHNQESTIDESIGKGEAIVDFLRKSEGPVSRELLFKFLWGREAQDKEDYVRLSRKVYRLKKQFNVDIQYRKGCYLLAPVSKKRVS